MNTGSFDPLPDIADAARSVGAWLHVDGAFGLWAAASPSLAHLVDGAELADSWATDAHKWLNVPYDSGIAFCAHPDSHRSAIGAQAEYLIQADEGGVRDEVDWTPEFSRRARGFTVYAALRSLGRSGVAELIDRTCAHARRFAEELAPLPGFELLNDVVLNQVLFRFESDDANRRCSAPRSGQRRSVAERDDLGRTARDPYLRVELADERRGRRAHRRGVRGRRLRRRPGPGAVDIAVEAPSEHAFEPFGHARSGRPGRPRSPRLRPRAGTRGPRWRCSRWPSAHRDSPRARRPTRRESSLRLRALRARSRTRCYACCVGVHLHHLGPVRTRSTKSLTCVGVATPIVSARTISSASSCSQRASDASRIDASFEGAAERDADRRGRRKIGRADDRRRPGRAPRRATCSRCAG